MRVDVPGRHARHPEALGERFQAAVQRAVVASERALQLDAERVAPERRQQAPHRRLVAHTLARAAAQADEPFGVLFDLRERDARRFRTSPRYGGHPITWPGEARIGVVALRLITGVHLPARVRVRVCEQATEVCPAAPVTHKQSQVTMLSRTRGTVVAEAQLRSMDRPQPQPLRCLRELHRAADRVVVSQCESRVPALDRRRDELLGKRCSVEERKGRVAMELDVRHERMFAQVVDGSRAALKLSVLPLRLIANSVVSFSGLRHPQTVAALAPRPAR